MSRVWLITGEDRRRFGLKGPRAAEFLAAQQLAVPQRANTWSTLRAGRDAAASELIARLGTSEFFIEESADASTIALLEQRLEAGEPGVYPVLREDRALIVGGADAPAVLAEVCNIDFAALMPPQVVMTLMIGVSVLALPQTVDGQNHFRIWYDPSFGSYLESELRHLIEKDHLQGRAQ